MNQDVQYSASDRALARSILQLDVAGVNAALEAGATAHKAPFRQISWALLPVCVSVQQRDPLEAVTEDVQTMVRTLIREGAPTTGLSHLVGAGVRFSDADMAYFLDNWLWRDADEVQKVVQLLGDNDDTVRALVETGHVPVDLAMPSGLPILQHALERDMGASVYALCGIGADPNVMVSHPVLGEVSAIEASVRDGKLRTAMALLASGAFYEGGRLAELAAAHSEEAKAAVADGVQAFESDQARSLADLVERPAFARFVDAAANRSMSEAVIAMEAARARGFAGVNPTFEALTKAVGKRDEDGPFAPIAPAPAPASDPFLDGFADIAAKPSAG